MTPSTKNGHAPRSTESSPYSLCQNLVSFPVLSRITSQAPLLALPFRMTTKGHGCVHTLDRNVLRSIQKHTTHTTTPHHHHHSTTHHTTTHNTPHTHHHTTPPATTPQPSALSSFSPLSSPTFFIHTKENNRLPFDTKFFANLHNRENHDSHGDSSKQKKNGRQPDSDCNIGFAEVGKNQPIRRNTQKQRLQNSHQNLTKKKPREKLKFENPA